MSLPVCRCGPVNSSSSAAERYRNCWAAAMKWFIFISCAPFHAFHPSSSIPWMTFNLFPRGKSFVSKSKISWTDFWLDDRVLDARTCVCLCLSGYLWGWEGLFVVSLLFLAFVLLFKYERCHINKICLNSDTFANTTSKIGEQNVKINAATTHADIESWSHEVCCRN